MKKRSIRITVSILVLLLMCGAGSAYILYQLLLAPQTQCNEVHYIQIYPNEKVESITQKISQAGQLKQDNGIKLLFKHYDYASKVKEGNYQICPKESARTIVLRLLSGNQSPIKLVVPSTRTIDRLAKAIAKQVMADSTAFMKVFTDEERIHHMGYTAETFPSLFIPNTYEVYWNITPEKFVLRMQKEHKAFWNEKRLAKAKAAGLTPVEVSTLASIVDEETAKNDEKPMVAGLYLNRLHRGILLQADPTVKFAMQDFELKRIYLEHLNIDSPYNTYKYAGLPPGPIRIPTISGIESVLNAQKHNYLYMCAKEDFSGYHNFATTLSQHNANARRYHQALNKRKIK